MLGIPDPTHDPIVKMWLLGPDGLHVQAGEGISCQGQGDLTGARVVAGWAQLKLQSEVQRKQKRMLPDSGFLCTSDS